MSKSYEIQGDIHSIGETTEYGNNGFTKREFVVKLTGEDENPSYPNYVALELIKDKCAMMDSYNVGDEIQAHFNLSGRLWSGNGQQEKCFTSLQAWRVSYASGPAASPKSNGPQYDDNDYNKGQYGDKHYDNNASSPPPEPPAADDYDDIPF